MKSWLISIPVWGPAYREIFLDVTLPSIELALDQVETSARFLIHTDRPELLAKAFRRDVEFRTVPRGSKYEAFGRGHQEGLQAAQPGEFVALLNADLVVSIEVFAACDRRFSEGKKAIAICGARTVHGDTYPPVGASAGAVHDYTMEHLHPINVECFFGKGRTGTPSILYFRDDQGTVMRCFHVHPFAVVSGPGQVFEGTTDWDLLSCFTLDEIHVVTDRDEMAMAEISPIDKAFPLVRKPIDVSHVVQWARKRTTPRHREMFAHRMLIQGKASGRDEAIVANILKTLG